MNRHRYRSAGAGDNSAAFIIPPLASGPIIVEGKGSTVTDDVGRKYLDLEAGPGVSSVGHCHPRVVEAVREQAGKLLHAPAAFLSHMSASLAERLSRLTGGLLNRTFFANSGAESNDGAVKLALKHALNTGKKGFGIIALEHSFHGRLSLPLSLTGLAERKKGFGPYASFPGVMHVPAPYCYRCPLHLKPTSCAGACADVVEEQLKTRSPGEAAIMIAEPILGVGGIIAGPQSYWDKIKGICSRNKIALIIDEVFCGFGRTGKMFAHQHYDLKPDVMSFAKALGGGVPIAGFSATEEVGGAFEKGDHLSTFGMRNHLGLAAAHAVLDTIEEEGLVDAAAEKGERLSKGLESLARRHECIGDVRGKGLMVGIELVHDREKKTPGSDLAPRLVQEMNKRGALVGATGVYNSIIRITPPLVMTNDEIDTVLDRLDEGLAALK